MPFARSLSDLWESWRKSGKSWAFFRKFEANTEVFNENLRETCTDLPLLQPIQLSRTDSLAFRRGLIIDGESWMGTIASRNRSSHAYDEETASHLVEMISTRYLGLFQRFEERMREIGNDH